MTDATLTQRLDDIERHAARAFQLVLELQVALDDARPFSVELSDDDRIALEELVSDELKRHAGRGCDRCAETQLFERLLTKLCRC